MKQQIYPRAKFAISLLASICLLIAACSKENEEELDRIAITPTPTQAGEPSSTPLSQMGMPLSPMETWCESMMVKPNQEWTSQDAKKFSQQCLYE